MSEWKLPWDGGCRCGGVRIRITQAPMLSVACHCTGCQRMSASAFSLTIAVPSAGFTVIAGEPVIGGLHGATKHHMCPHCMSWVFTRPEGMPELVNVRATMLDDHAWFEPFVEMFTGEKLAWASTGAAHSFARVPEVSQIPALLADFAARSARP
jgi:hypothetical protein